MSDNSKEDTYIIPVFKRPRIKMVVWFSGWYCKLLGYQSIDRIGFGNTPQEAYNDWKEKNGRS